MAPLGAYPRSPPIVSSAMPPLGTVGNSSRGNDVPAATTSLQYVSRVVLVRDVPKYTAPMPGSPVVGEFGPSAK